jgi:hypothetical protein
MLRSHSIRLVVALVVALVLALPAGLVAQHVHTDRADARVLPLPKSDDVFHFLVYGDRTGGPAEGIEVLKQAVHDTNLLDPDLVMTVGDLVQGYNTQAPWMEQMREYHEVMGGLKMPWFPVAGNHDVYWRGPDSPKFQHEENYETHFGPLWYWFQHKDCGFFVLYSDEGNRETGDKGYRATEVNQFSAEQLSWLKAELEKTDELDHVFVFLHHPKWQSQYTGANWDVVHEMLVKTGKCRAVFAGHIHRMTYGGVRDGIEYFTLATVGGSLRGDVPGMGLMHHMNVVTVREDGFQVAAIPVGQVADPRSFTEEFLADADEARGVSAEVIGQPLALTADGSTSGQVALRVTNPCDAKLELTLELGAVGGGGWTIAPDHHHGALERGESKTFRFHVERGPSGFDRFAMPKATLTVDYLAAGARVTMESRSTELNVDLSRVPLDVGDAGTALPNRVLRLDGRNCLTVEPAAFADLPDGPLTLEAWMRADDLDGRTGLVGKCESSEFGIFVSDAKTEFSVHVGGKYSSARDDEAKALRPNTWHHVAGVFDGAQTRVYVDGRLITTAPGKGERTRNDLPLVIGGDVSNRWRRVTSLFQGALDEVRLSTVVRYDGESFTPQRRFEADEATWLLLHLDRCIGPFHVDSSGRQHHARAVGDVVLEPMVVEATSAR